MAFFSNIGSSFKNSFSSLNFFRLQFGKFLQKINFFCQKCNT